MSSSPQGNKKANRSPHRSSHYQSSVEWDNIVKAVQEKANQMDPKAEESKENGGKSSPSASPKAMKMLGVSNRKTMDEIPISNINPQPAVVITPLTLKSKLHVDYELNNENSVTAATLPALVELLSPETVQASLELNYLDHFLLTYRSFTTPHELFDELKKRCFICVLYSRP